MYVFNSFKITYGSQYKPLKSNENLFKMGNSTKFLIFLQIYFLKDSARWFDKNFNSNG